MLHHLVGFDAEGRQQLAQLLDDSRAQGWNVITGAGSAGAPTTILLHQRFESKAEADAAIADLSQLGDEDFNPFLADKFRLRDDVYVANIIGTNEGLKHLSDLGDSLFPSPRDTETPPKTPTGGDEEEPAANGAGPAARPSSPASKSLVDIQDKLWLGLGNKQQPVAEAYFTQAILREIFETEKSRVPALPAMPELALLSVLPPDSTDGETIARRLLDYRVAMEENRLLLDSKHLQFVGHGVVAAGEIVDHMKRWRQLSRYVPMILAFSSAFAGTLMIVAFTLAADKKIDGPALALVLFVLAIVAISPAVLLLIERPLKGLDEYMPSGAAKPEEDKPKTPEAPAASAKSEETAK